MASKTSSALILLAFFGVALFLQVALADEASNGDVIIASKNADMGSFMSPSDDLDPTEQVEDNEDEQRPDMTDQGMSEEDLEIQPYVYVPEADEVEVIPESADDELDQQQSESTPASAHPFARILHERASKKCIWSSKKCKKFYHWAGCCSKMCVNLANSNRHCGKCKKCCDTKRGYFCKSGKCTKHHSSSSSCKKTKCKGENTCCRGKCVNLGHDCNNCGKCGSKCPWGSACCNRKCKNLKTDCTNCGKCGVKCSKGKVCCNGRCIFLKHNSGHCGGCGNACGWGRKCCHGKCVSVTSDKNNCGHCGHKCGRHVKCKFGICGYGHE